MNNTTIKTAASSILTDLQAARHAVELAGRLYANQHTRATKTALRQAQAQEVHLLKEYHDARLLQLAQVTEQMKRAQ